MQIELRSQWYYAAGLVEGRTPLMHAGVYRVPHDMPVELARRAIAEGLAVEVGKPQAPQTVRPGLEAVPRRWDGQTVIVAAPGPSLTEDVAEQCKGVRTIVVNDAWRRLPWADVLYACDRAWWQHHQGAAGFKGEKWSTHDDANNGKIEVAEAYGVRLVAGAAREGFSTDPTVIHYGSNGGFQAVNLGILMGAARVVLVGFDMRVVDGMSHFFGDHPAPLRTRTGFSGFIPPFERAAKSLPPGVEIVNATPGSALTCFPMMGLDDALSQHDALPKPDAAAASPRRGASGGQPAADRAGAAQAASRRRLPRHGRADRAQPSGGNL
jgi:hypothetical protein